MTMLFPLHIRELAQNVYEEHEKCTTFPRKKEFRDPISDALNEFGLPVTAKWLLSIGTFGSEFLKYIAKGKWGNGWSSKYYFCIFHENLGGKVVYEELKSKGLV